MGTVLQEVLGTSGASDDKIYRGQMGASVEASENPLRITIQEVPADARQKTVGPIHLIRVQMATSAPEAAGDADITSRVSELVKNEPGLDQMDIALRLGLSLEMASLICSELLRRGRIKPS